MDPEKVVAIQAWSCPRIVRALRGFLGLTRYYRKFIAGYGAVTEPLTTLLKGSVFTWILEADAAFLTLKKALISSPLLQLLDFPSDFLWTMMLCHTLKFPISGCE
jgi:hypothetical protein